MSIMFENAERVGQTIIFHPSQEEVRVFQLKEENKQIKNELEEIKQMLKVLSDDKRK